MVAVIPLSDASRRPAHFPYVTILLIVANGFVFLCELVGGEEFVTRWAAVPAEIVGGHHWLTLLTAMFMHGSWSHILGNMVFLWAFGPEIEDALNPWRYGGLYLVGGLVAMLAQVLASPTSPVPCLGASGAVAAVMGAFLMIYPHDEIRSLWFFLFFVRITFIPAALLIGVWFLIQLLNVGTVATVQVGGVAYVAHIGGFLFGVAAARLLLHRQRVAEQTWRRL